MARRLSTFPSRPPHPAPRPGSPRRRLIASASLAILAALSGCAAHHANQGARNIDASYSWRTLTVDLPGSVRVPAAIAAGQAALLARGYSISSREVTDDRGHIQGLPPHGSSLDRVSISAAATGDGTRGEVTIEPWGDEAASRAILDAMLTRLGL